LRQRAALSTVPPLQTPVFRLAHGKVVSWAAFNAAETELLELLSRRELPLVERLRRGTRVLGGGPEPVPDRAFLAPFLAAVGCAEQPAPAPTWRCEPVLVPILRNLIFSKVHSYPFDLATAFNLAIVLALTALYAEAAHGDPPWEALGWMFMHGGGMAFLLGEGGRERRERLSDPAFGRGLLGLTEA
jgi:hypothetical protein